MIGHESIERLKSRRKPDHFSLSSTITFTLQRNWCNIILHRSNKIGTQTIFCMQRFGCNNNARQQNTKHELKTKVNQLFLFLFHQRLRQPFICFSIFSKNYCIVEYIFAIQMINNLCFLDIFRMIRKNINNSSSSTRISNIHIHLMNKENLQKRNNTKLLELLHVI